MGHALASDRLQLKLGDPITPCECCELHAQATTSLREQQNMYRFELHQDTHLPDEWVPMPCGHTRPQLTYKTCGFASPLQRMMLRGARKAYSFEAALVAQQCGGAEVFLVAWSYYARKSLARWRIVSLDGDLAQIRSCSPFGFHHSQGRVSELPPKTGCIGVKLRRHHCCRF